MNVIKRIVILLVIISVITGGIFTAIYTVGHFTNQRKKERDYQALVKAISGDSLIIDETDYDWELDSKKIIIRIYIRNTSQNHLRGIVVCQIELEPNKLDYDYLELIEKKFGKEELKKSLINYVKKGKTLGPKGKSLKRFIERGFRFEKGELYEMVETDDTTSYFFNIRHFINLKSGEIDKFEEFIEIPPKKIGFRCNVNIVGVER